MALDTYRKEQERLTKEQEKKDREERGEPEPVKREKMPLRDIMADKEKNSLLATMLKSSGDSSDLELAGRLASGQLEAGDAHILEERRVSFEEKMYQVEDINKELTVDMALELGKNNKDIQDIINLTKPENLVKMVQDRLAEVAMGDPDRFRDVASTYDQYKEFKKGDYKAFEDQVKALCEKRGFKQDDFLKSLAVEDLDKRNKALTDIIRKSWGKNLTGSLRRVVDFISLKAFSRDSADKVAGYKQELEEILSQLDEHKKNIGRVLAVTINENKEMRDGMFKAISGEQTKIERVGIKDAKASVLETEDQYKANWNRFRDEHTKPPARRWADLSLAEKDILRNNFNDEENARAVEKTKKKGGVWSFIFGGMFKADSDKWKGTLN